MYLIGFFVALLSSAMLTRWTRDLAVAHGWTSAPSSDRHIHTQPVPRLGGIAIFSSLWIAVLISLRWSATFGTPVPILHNIALAILGPATLIFAMGLFDDIFGLDAKTKFGIEAIAACWLYRNGFGITTLPIHAGGLRIGWAIGLLLTIVWVLWITNAFNLIDGLDGLAAGAALFSALVASVAALVHNQSAIMFLTIILVGAIAGFLRYNFNPATIFLGDCGSLLIGFLLSAIGLAGSEKSPTLVAVAIPLVSLGLPILDVAIAVLRRLLSGRRLFSADREHIHHKLLGRGVPHRQAVLVLYGVSACFGLLSLFLLNPNGESLGIVLTILGIGVLVGIQQLRYHEFVELGRVANRTLNQRHIIANNLRVRRAAEVLFKCESFETMCRILRECLQPVGFDGFGLTAFSSSGLLELSPGQRSSERAYLIREGITEVASPAWSLCFRLFQENGDETAELELYRIDARTPLRLDINIFTSTEFPRALGCCLSAIRRHEAKAPDAFGTSLLVLSASAASSD